MPTAASAIFSCLLIHAMFIFKAFGGELKLVLGGNNYVDTSCG